MSASLCEHTGLRGRLLRVFYEQSLPERWEGGTGIVPSLRNQERPAWSGVLGSLAEVWGWRDGIYAKHGMEGRLHPLGLIVHMAHPGKKWDPLFQLSGECCFPQILLFLPQSQCCSSPGLRWTQGFAPCRADSGVENSRNLV